MHPFLSDNLNRLSQLLSRVPDRHKMLLINHVRLIGNNTVFQCRASNSS